VTRRAADLGTPALLVALALGLGAWWWALGGPADAPDAPAAARVAKKAPVVPAREPAPPPAASVVVAPPQPEVRDIDEEMSAWLMSTLEHPIRCRLSAPAPTPLAGALHYGRPESYDLAGIVTLFGDTLIVDARHPERGGAVYAELDEGRVLTFELVGDPLRCDPDPVVLPEEADLAAVRLVVQNAGTAFQTHASGCATRGVSDEHGVVELTIPVAELTEGCTVTVTRLDGQIWSAPAEIELGPEDADQDVAVELPAWATAGLGVRLDVTEDGIGIDTVYPGTPAEAAGLQPGDRLLSADGHAVPADADAARSLFTGPEGTDVVLEVESDGEIRTVRVTRAVIEE
jgi:hypothetical protein